MPRPKKGKKTAVERILEEFRKATPLKKIKEKIKGEASYYNAYVLFHDEMEIKVSKLQVSNAECKAVESTLERMKQKYAQLVTEGTTLENMIQERNNQLRTVEKNIEEQEKTLSELKTLAGKDISPQVINSIAKMDVENRDDLLTRIKTVEDHNREKKGYDKLLANKRILEKEIKTDTTEKKRLESKIKVLQDDENSEKQRLDEAKLATRTYKAVVAVTQSYLRDGYSIQDLKSLREGLKTVQVKGKQILSITRLITGVQNMKTLDRISDEIDGKKNELAVLATNISKAKGTLDGYEKHLLSTLAETKQNLTATFAEIDEKTVNSFQVWGKSISGQLTEVGENYVDQISKLDGNVKTSFGNAEKNLKTHLMTMNLQAEDTRRETQKMSKVATGITSTLEKKTSAATAHLNQKLKIIAREFQVTWKDYNSLKDKIRDQEILGKYSHYLLGVLMFPEKIKEIPLPIISHLMGRINLYTQVSFPEATALPSEKASSGFSGLSQYTKYKYKLSALTLFLKEEFEKRAFEAAKNEPGKS